MCTYLSRADGLTELARYAPLLSVGVPAEGMLSPEARTEGTLLKWVHQSDRVPEESRQSHGEPYTQLHHIVSHVYNYLKDMFNSGFLILRI